MALSRFPRSGVSASGGTDAGGFAGVLGALPCAGGGGGGGGRGGRGAAAGDATAGDDKAAAVGVAAPSGRAGGMLGGAPGEGTTGREPAAAADTVTVTAPAPPPPAAGISYTVLCAVAATGAGAPAPYFATMAARCAPRTPAARGGVTGRGAASAGRLASPPAVCASLAATGSGASDSRSSNRRKDANALLPRCELKSVTPLHRR